MISIVEQKIETSAVLDAVSSPRAGASVLFVGTTRQFTGQRETAQLSYECYQAMATKQLTELSEQARQRWPVIHCAIVHRIGEVAIEEASVAVAVSTPHRKDAFEAAQWIMEELKKQVPIWKKEHWVDGDQQWIHDGTAPQPNSQTGDVS